MNANENRIASDGTVAPPVPQPCFVVGVTGHRSTHSSYPGDHAALDAVIVAIMQQIETALQAVAGDRACQTTLVTLLADGTDQLAADDALERGWRLMTPLPFGQRLNAAINARPQTPADARAILAGEAVADAPTAARVAAIERFASRARLFELADEDAAISRLLLDALDRPGDTEAVEKFQLATARRAAMAGSILVEQADLLIAVWDGRSVDSVGGTGHTVSAALQTGCPVVRIDPAEPQDWKVYRSVEALAASQADRQIPSETLAECIRQAVVLDAPQHGGRYAGLAAIAPQCWRPHSSALSHAYRRIEAVFGQAEWRPKFASLRDTYEKPERIGEGSQARLLQALGALPGADAELPARVEREVLRRFAWTDAISSHLADRYRSGMVLNFMMGAAAIIVGTMYLPLVDVSRKWIFAALELGLLLAIIANTANGLKYRLHGRWFETRRAAEYLRHSPFLLAIGTARAPGEWPRGVKSWWPEWYARHALRAVGLPEARIDNAYLRGMLEFLRDHHVLPQLAYHRGKSARLARVHHKLDSVSELSFAVAVLVVTLYLVLALLAAAGAIDAAWLAKAAKWFTVAAVALPTIGGAMAAIRYFADFERFAEISEVTARRLDGISQRIAALMSAPDERLDFGRVARIVHDTDDIVFAEIQAWQAVFSGKRMTVPA